MIKRDFLSLNYLLYRLSLFGNLRENITHGVSYDIYQLIEERFGEADGSAIANRSPKDSPQHVVAIRVAWEDTICNGKAERPDMVSDDPEGNIRFHLLWGTRVSRARKSACIFFATQLF